MFDDEVVFSLEGEFFAAPYQYDADKAEATIGASYRVRPSYEAIVGAVGAEGDERAAVPYSPTKPVETTSWNAVAAEKRLRKWAGDDNKKLSRAYAWWNGERAFKLPHHDVQGGELVVSRKAVLTAGAAIQGSRGGVKLPKADLAAVKLHLGKHYRQFKMTAPWDRAADLDDNEQPLAGSSAGSETQMSSTSNTNPEGAAAEDLSKRAAELDGKLSKANADAEALRVSNKSLEDRATALQTEVAGLTRQLAERDLDELVGKKITPAEKDVALKIAALSRDIFTETIVAYRARPDMALTRTTPTIPTPQPPPSTVDPTVATDADIAAFNRALNPDV